MFFIKLFPLIYLLPKIDTNCCYYLSLKYHIYPNPVTYPHLFYFPSPSNLIRPVGSVILSTHQTGWIFARILSERFKASSKEQGFNRLLESEMKRASLLKISLPGR